MRRKGRNPGESCWGRKVKGGGQECPLSTMRAINKSVAKNGSAGQPEAAFPTRICPALLHFLLGDPFVGAGLQKIEGEGSAVEHFVVEFADVEFGA